MSPGVDNAGSEYQARAIVNIAMTASIRLSGKKLPGGR
jgi:hypothetical protein